MTERPCGCVGEQLCPQHIQAMPRRERLAYELRQRQAAKAAEYERHRAEVARIRAAFAAARAAGLRARHHHRLNGENHG